MKIDIMEELLRLSRATIKALEYKNKTIVSVNKDMLLEAKELLNEHKNIFTVGVKNTDQINRKYIRKLINSKEYLWHTIDDMSEGGRAIDINLLNPLTGKVMTGSSSCSAINVLYGINDVAIGTDGGGSVLAPALSLNLYSIMAKGMGLTGSTEKASTDGISFVPGIGVISHSLDLAEHAIREMTGIYDECKVEGLKIAVCKI